MSSARMGGELPGNGVMGRGGLRRGLCLVRSVRGPERCSTENQIDTSRDVSVETSVRINRIVFGMFVQWL